VFACSWSLDRQNVLADLLLQVGGNLPELGNKDIDCVDVGIDGGASDGNGNGRAIPVAGEGTFHYIGHVESAS
jgi:hypothetical protein